MSEAPLHHGFWQWLQSGDTERMALIVMPLFFIVLAIIVTTAVVFIAVHRRRVEAALKRELLDRGMSAEEIAIIISATSTRRNADAAGMSADEIATEVRAKPGKSHAADISS